MPHGASPSTRQLKFLYLLPYLSKKIVKVNKLSPATTLNLELPQLKKFWGKMF